MASSEFLEIPSSLRDRCCREYGWNKGFTQNALQGYQHFMKLKKQHQDWNAETLSPSTVVDQVWHLHILDVQHYVKACQDYCHGKIIGHDPDGGVDVEARKVRRQNTTFGLVSMLGKDGLDSDIWNSLDGQSSVQSSHTTANDKVSESDNKDEPDENDEAGNRKRQRRGDTATTTTTTTNDATAIRRIHHQQEQMTLRIKDQTGNMITLWTVKPTTKMERLFEAYYAKKRGVPWQSLRFRSSDQYEHCLWDEDDTPQSLGLKNQDQIDCLLEQTGC